MLEFFIVSRGPVQLFWASKAPVNVIGKYICKTLIQFIMGLFPRLLQSVGLIKIHFLGLV